MKKKENKKNRDDKQKKNTTRHKVTKPNMEPKKHYLVDDLDQKHQQAVFLRLEGAEHQYIAKELGYNYTYVRMLFMEGGICKLAYEQLVAEVTQENRRRFEKLQEEMEDAAPEAFTHLRRFAKRNWKAAESLLHISGFSPVQKVKAEVENGDLGKVTDAIDKLSDYARRTTPVSDKATT